MEKIPSHIWVKIGRRITLWIRINKTQVMFWKPLSLHGWNEKKIYINTNKGLLCLQQVQCWVVLSTLFFLSNLRDRNVQYDLLLQISVVTFISTKLFAFTHIYLLVIRAYFMYAFLYMRPNHCGRHLGKINGHKSTYIKVLLCTFWWITMFLTGKYVVKLFECKVTHLVGWLTQE